jgi:hypothetical protein
MCSIPLDLERRLERRWVAKFASPVASTTPKSVKLNGTVTDLPRPQEPMKNPLAGVPGFNHYWNRWNWQDRSQT